MVEATYWFLEAATLSILVLGAAGAVIVVYAGVGLLLLPPSAALDRALAFVAGSAQFARSASSGWLRPRLAGLRAWRERQAADLVGGVADDERGRGAVDQARPLSGARVADLLIPTMVLGTSIIATALLVVVGAGLIGLDSDSRAASALPWVVGIAVVTTTAYSWSTARDGEASWSRLALLGFSAGVGAALLFSVLRGIDIWSANIIGGGRTPHELVRDLRDFLPLPIWAAAELALIVGAAVAHRGLRGLWLLTLTIPAVLLEVAGYLAYAALALVLVVALFLATLARHVVALVVALPSALWARLPFHGASTSDALPSSPAHQGIGATGELWEANGASPPAAAASAIESSEATADMNAENAEAVAGLLAAAEALGEQSRHRDAHGPFAERQAADGAPPAPERGADLVRDRE